MISQKKQTFIKPITDVISDRISVRSYISNPLDEKVKKIIVSYMETINSPFNGKVRFKLEDVGDARDNSNVKLGTYGMIRGASTFILSAVKKGEMDLEALGYEFEKLILYSTSLGLGTCWLGGTFKKHEFAKVMELDDNELLPVVSPIGYPKEGKNILDALVRMAAGSKNRKSWDELYFNNDFHTMLNKEDSGDYATALEMLRLSPSASNKQPWRVVKEGDSFHFYLCHAKGYSKGLGFDIQRIDMGIAMCHFDLTLIENGINGHWEKVSTNISRLDENTEYIISWLK